MNGTEKRQWRKTIKRALDLKMIRKKDARLLAELCTLKGEARMLASIPENPNAYSLLEIKITL